MVLAGHPVAAGVAQVVVRADCAPHARAHVDLQPARVARRREARRLRRNGDTQSYDDAQPGRMQPLSTVARGISTARNERFQFSARAAWDLLWSHEHKSSAKISDRGRETPPAGTRLWVVQVVQNHHAAVLRAPDGVELVMVPLMHSKERQSRAYMRAWQDACMLTQLSAVQT